MKYCEFCGDMGATRCFVEGRDYSGYFYLCDECDEQWEFFDLPGKNRADFLDNVFRTTLPCNGPKSDAFERDRSNWGLLNTCENCHRKTSISGTSFGDMVEITDDFRKVLPKPLRRKGNVYLCPECTEKMLCRMVDSWKEEELPIYIGFKEFIGAEDGEPWDFLNQKVLDMLERRLRGEPAKPEETLEKPVELKCLDVSLDLIGKKDFQLFYQDGELERKEGKVTPKNENPLIIAPYEHGFLLYVASVELYKHILEDFGYSRKFIKIIFEARERGYDYVRVDSVGPKYKELS